MYDPTLVICTVLLSMMPTIDGGKILVFPLDGSHWVNMKVLIEELHSKGHEITLIRPEDNWYIKEKSSFYTSITIPNTGGFEEEFFSTFVSRQLDIQRQGLSFLSQIWSRIKIEMEVHEQFFKFHKRMSEMVVEIFENEELIQFLQKAEFDVVLTDPSIGGGTMLAHHLRIPLVFNVRWTIQGEAHFVSAPSPLSYCPFTATQLTDKMTFPQRVINILAYTMGTYTMASITEPNYKPLVHRYFGPDVDYSWFFQEADIWLMRNDFVFEFPRPTMPNFVYIAGFQCKPARPLPQDLEEFVQSSGEHGLIVMSLGTIVGQLPLDVTEEIAAAFAEVPQKVIWRYIGPRPINLGNNTLLVDWLPQNDLLGHPKTRLFVAHGGTNGVQEAIYHGVPLVGLPLVFDQPDNLSRMSAKGAATIVDFSTLDRNTFLSALKEVLYKPSYRENMQRLSRLHRDQPIKPLDRAVFWIEYVMRHKGAPHLRTQASKLSWIVYNSMDVVVTLLGVILFATLAGISIVKFLWKVIFCTRKVKHE
ncbi:UDP-glucuronosyltransferase 2A2-like [Osmerus eperlanus]|uniref:UDP-glucuronosyltransferase 2A2-like n=1 Tax=Osmerus eperlanus TaxID=29151 RepID=UPI002E0D3821